MKPAADPNPSNAPDALAIDLPLLCLGDHFWKPWYAKAWWISIPIYWAPAGTDMGAPLRDFYTSGFAVPTNIIFLPITAGMILGFGYLRRLLTEGESADPWHDCDVGEYRRPGMPHPFMDELDPRSDSLWIGNRTRNSLDRS